MAEALYSPQRLRIPVLRLKNKDAFKLFNYTRLPGYAELGGKIAADMGNRFNNMFCHGHIIACRASRVLTATPFTIMWKKMGHQMELVRS